MIKTVRHVTITRVNLYLVVSIMLYDVIIVCEKDYAESGRILFAGVF